MAAITVVDPVAAMEAAATAVVTAAVTAVVMVAVDTEAMAVAVTETMAEAAVMVEVIRAVATAAAVIDADKRCVYYYKL